MLKFAEIVNWADIRDTVVFGFIAGVGITCVYGFTLLGTIRARETYQDGRAAQAILYGAIGLIGLLGTAGGVILALITVSRNG